MNLTFNFIDFLVVAVVAISAGYAAFRGFLSEVLTIFAWAGAAFATLYLGPWLIPMAHSMISQQWLAAIAAYACVFLAAFLPLSFMIHRFSQTVKNSSLGPLDRGLGIAFGVVRGLLIVGLAYLAFTYFTPVKQQPEWLLTARTLPVMQSTAQVLLSVVPDQAPRDYVTAEPGKPDRLGDLIRQQNEQANMVSKSSTKASSASVKKGEKTYGASDRSALEKLFETSGGNGKP